MGILNCYAKSKNQKKPKPKRNTLEQCHEFKLLLQSYETKKKKKKKKKRVCRFVFFRCWYLFCLRIGKTFFGSFGHRLLLLLFHSFHKIPVNEMNTLCLCSYMFHSRMFAALILPLQTHKMVSKEWIEFVVSSSWNSKNSILFLIQL